jgi:hypothetical protein
VQKIDKELAVALAELETERQNAQSSIDTQVWHLSGAYNSLLSVTA